MLVNLIIDATDPRDNAMCDEIAGWLHYSPLRGAWTMTEIETDDDSDDEGRVTLTVTFHDPNDASDFRYWRGLEGRGRLI